MFTDEFRVDSGIVYPPFSKMYFEKYFYQYITQLYQDKKITQEQFDSYIPVFWTELQIIPGYDKPQLQSLLDELPKNKPLFTVVQHDDGIVFDVPSNLITFAMGGTGNIPLPLTYDNLDLFDDYKINAKTIFCSFVGSITHPCREKMLRTLENETGVLLVTDTWTNVIGEERQKLFLNVASKSRFTLAPRGYGKTSFRMYEALRLNSIPVYIYDDPWLPYQELLDWAKLAILVHVDDLDQLYNRLKNITDEQISEMLDYYATVEKYFTYDGMCEYILENTTKLYV